MDWAQLLDRWRYIKACAGPGRVTVLAVLGVLGTLGTIHDLFPSIDIEIITWVPPLPWYAWTIAILILILAFSIEGGFRVQQKIKGQLNAKETELAVLNTPSVSIKLHNVDQDQHNIQTIFLEITGEGVDYVRPEVFAMPAEELGGTAGRASLSIAPGIAASFGVNRGEPHNIAAVNYQPGRHVALQVVLPCKNLTSEQYLLAEYFRMKVYAFMKPKGAELEFEFGVRHDLLWARNIGSSETFHVRWRTPPDLTDLG